MADGFFGSPLELAVTVVAVFLVGLSKGGLGGMSLLGVPLMALVMSPITAAAILLPILVVMDVVSVAAWKNWVNWRILALVLPGALGGIGLGWLTAEVTSDAVVRLVVGLVSLTFVLRVALGRTVNGTVTGERPMAASFWGSSRVIRVSSHMPGHRPCKSICCHCDLIRRFLPEQR